MDSLVDEMVASIGKQYFADWLITAASIPTPVLIAIGQWSRVRSLRSQTGGQWLASPPGSVNPDKLLTTAARAPYDALLRGNNVVSLLASLETSSSPFPLCLLPLSSFFICLQSFSPFSCVCLYVLVFCPWGDDLSIKFHCASCGIFRSSKDEESEESWALTCLVVNWRSQPSRTVMKKKVESKELMSQFSWRKRGSFVRQFKK